MSDRSLADKAIDIKGKKYVMVHDRVNYFNDNYPDGTINTELISAASSDNIVIKATVVPDVAKPERYFSDYAQEVVGSGMINKTNAMENCSTSAIGRALGLMGIGVIDSVSSVDEINKAGQREVYNKKKKATTKQLQYINKLWVENYPDNADDLRPMIEKETGTKVENLTSEQASAIIERIMQGKL